MMDPRCRKITVPRAAAIPPEAGESAASIALEKSRLPKSAKRSVSTLYLTQPRSFPKAPRSERLGRIR